ncbi:MAG: phosphopantetheine-binding protein [Gammaproteobacteria bacterium]|nr:phosphopantetheine-binding protein [Gammaproteobacteria bacterium]
MATLDDIKLILGDVLQLGDKVDSFTADTGLLGEIAEFDSMAVVSVITSIEDNYGITVDDDEIDADTFETIGSLTAFVESKL